MKAVCAASVLLLGTACATGTDKGSETGTGATGAATARAAAGTWKDCALPGQPTRQCTVVTVPVDPARPRGGATVSLAVSRIPAADKDRRIGALVWNPGGPGISGRYVPAAQLPPELPRRFDLIGFDPRGTGKSQPVSECGEDDTVAEALEADDRKKAAAEARAYARSCAKRLGPAAGLLGTRAMAADLDAIRAALGERKLSLLTVSYGTLLGQQYAAAHPDRVRALVLDGTMDPALSGVRAALDASGAEQDKAYTSDDPDEAAPRQLSAILSGFTPWCRESGPSVCPVSADPVGRALALDDRKQVLSAAAAGGYVPGRWRELARALAAADRGDRSGLRGLADEGFPKELKAEGGSTLDLGYHLGVYCTDFAWPDSPAAIADAFGDAESDDDGSSRFTASQYLPCAAWPGRGNPLTAPGTTPPRAGTAVRPLVINGTQDPRTGIEGARAVARRLDARLVEFKGRAHGAVTAGVECAQGAAVRYLVTGSTEGGEGCAT